MAEKLYKIGHVRPSGSIEWLPTARTEEEARRQCEAANAAERGERSLYAAGHCATEKQDSGFTWVYVPLDS